MAISYKQHQDGETVELPQNAAYHMQCCDCSLVHDLHTSITDDGRVGLTVYRNNSETERLRGNVSRAGKYLTDARRERVNTMETDFVPFARRRARRLVDERNRSYSGHSGHVVAVAWSPDGKLIASGSTDKTAQVWQA